MFTSQGHLLEKNWSEKEEDKYKVKPCCQQHLAEQARGNWCDIDRYVEQRPCVNRSVFLRRAPTTDLVVNCIYAQTTSLPSTATYTLPVCFRKDTSWVYRCLGMNRSVFLFFSAWYLRLCRLSSSGCDRTADANAAWRVIIELLHKIFDNLILSMQGCRMWRHQRNDSSVLCIE